MSNMINKIFNTMMNRLYPNYLASTTATTGLSNQLINYPSSYTHTGSGLQNMTQNQPTYYTGTMTATASSTVSKPSPLEYYRAVAQQYNQYNNYSTPTYENKVLLAEVVEEALNKMFAPVLVEDTSDDNSV